MFLASLSITGGKYLEPKIRIAAMKPKTIPTDNSTSINDTAAVRASDCRIPSMVMTITSSTINIPIINTLDLSLIMFSSSSIFTVTTVLVTDMASAKNIESNCENPSVRATKNVTNRVPSDSAMPTTIDILPTDLSLVIGNSVPITNKRMIIPISASVLIVPTSCIKLNGGVNGPITIPAKRYPITIGCFNLWVTKTITAATIITTAKSWIKKPVSNCAMRSKKYKKYTT